MEHTERTSIFKKIIDKKLVVVYNQKAKYYSAKNSDFFSVDEVTFIRNIARESELYIEFVEGELNFINNIHNYFAHEIIVLNLTRRGSKNNQKCAVTTICDLKGIPIIGSSALTMGLCRSKDYLQPLLELVDIKYPKIINYEAIDRNSFYIIKKTNSAGSLDLTRDSVKQGKDLTLDDFTENHIVQEYAEGYELEVPFLIKEEKIQILGLYLLNIGSTKYFTTQNDCILDFETSDTFDYYFTEIALTKVEFEKLHMLITNVCNLLKIENYGRIDFRAINFESVDTYKLFDISTSPFFVENSSFYLGCKNNVFDLLASTLDI